MTVFRRYQDYRIFSLCIGLNGSDYHYHYANAVSVFTLLLYSLLCFGYMLSCNVFALFQKAYPNGEVVVEKGDEY